MARQASRLKNCHAGLRRHARPSSGWALTEMRLEVINQRLSFRRLNDRPPPDHLLYFATPRGTGQPLLNNQIDSVTGETLRADDACAVTGWKLLRANGRILHLRRAAGPALHARRQNADATSCRNQRGRATPARDGHLTKH